MMNDHKLNERCKTHPFFTFLYKDEVWLLWYVFQQVRTISVGVLFWCENGTWTRKFKSLAMVSVLQRSGNKSWKEKFSNLPPSNLSDLILVPKALERDHSTPIDKPKRRAGAGSTTSAFSSYRNDFLTVHTFIWLEAWFYWKPGPNLLHHHK